MAIFLTIILIVFIASQIGQKISNKNGFATRYVTSSDVDCMDGHDFEYFCADLLRYEGFSHISITKGSNDQGVDIIAYKNGEKYAIQCKRYNKSLGNKPVQEVNTGRTIYGCSKAIVLTNNYFTKGAIEAASATGVTLWDRRKLNSLIRAKQHSISTKEGHSLFRSKHLGADLKTQLAALDKDALNKSVVKTICLLLVFIFVLTIVLLIVTNDQEAEKSDTQNAELPQTEINSTETHLEMCESVAYHDFSITITNMMFARHTGNLKYLDMVDSEWINCCVYADLENTGENPVDLKGYDVVLKCDGVEYKQTLIEDPEFLFYHQMLEPHKSLNGKVIDFQIPSSQQYSDSQIYIIFISPDGQNSKWKLR